MVGKRTIVITLIALVAIAGLGVGGYHWRKAWLKEQFLTVPPETPGRDLVFRIEPGQIFTTIAGNLKQSGLIIDARRFLTLARSHGKTASLRAGQFVLNTGWTPDRILRELTTSAGIMKKVVVREGLTWWQTAEQVQAAGVGTMERFAQAVKSPELLAEYGIQAKTAEGYLFPETYMLTPPKGDQSAHMAELMLKEFFKNAAEVWPDGLPQWNELHRAVIIASLVEKESGNVDERERIAGVFHNRLKRRMLIQCDPTIIYGLGATFDGNLTKSHLRDRSNPYNTYVHRGLPPGPICSPGLDALMAAVNPEQHKYLYFVAKGDGSHHFSSTLREHNNAVIKYQLRRNRKTYRSTSH